MEVARAIGKTGKMYSALDKSLFTGGEKTNILVKKLSPGNDIDRSALFNVFEKVAYDTYQGLDNYRNDFLVPAPQVYIWQARVRHFYIG